MTIQNMRGGYNPKSHSLTSTLSFATFSGGLNTVNKGLALGNGQAAELLNYQYIDTGAAVDLMTRTGLKRLSDTATGHAIKDLGFFLNRSAGAVEKLAVSNSKLFKLSAGVFVEIGDIESARGRGCQLGDKWLVADGGYLKFYDGMDFNLCWDSGSYILESIAGYGSGMALDATAGRAGQKYTTPDWGIDFTLPIESITFWISKTATPTGTAVARVRKVSDDSIVATSASKNVADFEAAGKEEVFTFASGSWEPATAYYLAVEYGGGDAVNYITVHHDTSTAADGNAAKHNGATWSNIAGDAYIKVSPNLPHKASFAVAWFNRLWTNDIDEPTFLRYSDVRDGCYWDLDDDEDGSRAGFFELDCLEITAVCPYQDLLSVHCGTGQKSVHWISGRSPSDFARDPAIWGVGAINQDCVAYLGNDLVFLDSGGVVSMAAWQKYGEIEAAKQSDPVADQIIANDDRFCGTHLADQQFWLSTPSGAVMVYDSQFSARGRDRQNKGALWSKYVLEMGADVSPSAFAEFNSEIYAGDSAGHLWHLDTQDPQFTYDGPSGGLVRFDTKILTGAKDGSTARYKQANWVRALAHAYFGGEYKIRFYRDGDSEYFHEITVSLPADSSMALDEATFTLDDAIMALDYTGSNLTEHKVNFLFGQLQIGIEAVNSLGKPFFFFGLDMDIAVLMKHRGRKP